MVLVTTIGHTFLCFFHHFSSLWLRNCNIHISLNNYLLGFHEIVLFSVLRAGPVGSLFKNFFYGYFFQWICGSYSLFLHILSWLAIWSLPQLVVLDWWQNYNICLFVRYCFPMNIEVETLDKFLCIYCLIFQVMKSTVVNQTMEFCLILCYDHRTL